MRDCLVAWFLLSVAIACGCRPEDDRALAYDELPDTAVVANVSGVRYTKADLERDSTIVGVLLDVSGRTDQKQALEQNRLQRRRQMVDGFVRRETLVRLAEHKGMSLSDAEASAFRNQLLGDVLRECPQKTNDVDAALGPRASAFAVNLRREALAAKAEEGYRAELRSHVSVAADEIASESRRLADRRREILAANVRLCRLATNAWRSIRAGNDFDVVGKKLMEMQKAVSYDFSVETADRPALAAGELSALLPTNGGIELFRAIGDSNSGMRISRIYFSLGTPDPECPLAEIRERMLAEKADKLYDVRMRQLRQSLGVTVRALR